MGARGGVGGRGKGGQHGSEGRARSRPLPPLLLSSLIAVAAMLAVAAAIDADIIPLPADVIKAAAALPSVSWLSSLHSASDRAAAAPSAVASQQPTAAAAAASSASSSSHMPAATANNSDARTHTAATNTAAAAAAAAGSQLTAGSAGREAAGMSAEEVALLKTAEKGGSRSEAGRGGVVGEERRAWSLDPDERFLWYGSQSGFGNQVIQLSWGLRMAALLNRTLIIPPKLPHFNPIPSIGRCERNPTKPNKIRQLAWQLYSQHISTRGYVSMADVLDLSGIPPQLIRTIDLRHFVAKFCHCDVSLSCSAAACAHLALPHHSPHTKGGDSRLLKKCLWECGARMGGNSAASRRWEREGQLFSVEFHCGDTLWTVGNYKTLQQLVAAVQPDPAISQAAYSNSKQGRKWPMPRNVLNSLGPGNPKAHAAKVMAFGSMFHPRIADMRKGWPHPIEDIRQVSGSFPFSPPIMAAARAFVAAHFPKPFACLHLRAGDGKFVKQLERNIRLAAEKLHALQTQHASKLNASEKIPLFLMTDLSPSDLQQKLLPLINKLRFSITNCSDQDLVTKAGREAIASEFGIMANRMNAQDMASRRHGTLEGAKKEAISAQKAKELQEMVVPMDKIKPPDDILLFVEQAICCHGKLGAVTTYASTASSFIHNLRSGGHCDLQPGG